MGSILSIAAGASAGALLRWRLATWLNPMLSGLPLGTLCANLVGGYLVGVAVAFFAARPDLPPEWRLLAITGFLGGFTTFSAFSAEVVENLANGRTGFALATVVLHVLGSLALTALGIASYGWLQSAGAWR
ncbi:fluoride efflux transporter CrcB [Ramlibacter pallidus]|uniref:Fluoride-specific ion channel FluC n=1 Tax=Ramlibacter pallidus TaxID=2780087 RepID=A0ABR9S729_9BURK|nr:fluoride efflux transporter CrcB [Ramlibacter pallidus]MBE7369288.1 fluoride efflux transporter CrcB [Ramlibacter pallidus]